MEENELIEAMAQAIKSNVINDLMSKAKKKAEEKKTVTLTAEDNTLQSPDSGWKLISNSSPDSGWKLISNSGKRPTGTFVLELVLFLKEGESNISGKEMFRRAKELDADLGQHYAELLLANQHLIPEAWQEFYLVFPGTVWQNPDGLRYVPYLCWDGRQWALNFTWLDFGWGDRYRLFRLRKSR